METGLTVNRYTTAILASLAVAPMPAVKVGWSVVSKRPAPPARPQ